MAVVEFSMAGTARPKGRPRARIQGKGKKAFVQTYTDEKTRAYEASVKKLAGAAMGARQPFQGPLSVSLQFRLQVPVSYSKKTRAAILSGEQPWFGPLDADNGAKAILDGMNGAVFLDDKQVMRLWVVKVPHEKPGVDVRVEALAEPV